MESTSELVLVTGGTGYRVRATVRSASRESAVRTAVQGAPTADTSWQVVDSGEFLLDHQEQK